MPANIYHQAIKQLAADEIGAGLLPAANAAATMDNPLCGDRVSLQLILEKNQIKQVAHQVRGCLLCKAAASIIGTAAEGCSEQEIHQVHDQLAAMLQGDSSVNWRPNWTSLSHFEPVQSQKSRHGCVLLPFKTLLRAMAKTE